MDTGTQYQISAGESFLTEQFSTILSSCRSLIWLYLSEKDKNKEKNHRDNKIMRVQAWEWK